MLRQPKLSPRPSIAFAALAGAAALWAQDTVVAAIDPTVAAAVGYNSLVAEYGNALPTGSGVSVSLVEGNENNSGFWIPQTESPEYAGKAFVTVSTGSLYYGSHAEQVALRWFGNSTSMTPGVASIQLWEANHWLASGLRKGTGMDPLSLNKVSNHSYGGSYGTATENEEALRRLDHLVHRDESIVVVGANNGAGSNLFPLWAQTYNGIVVGRTDGQHSAGYTNTDGAGRIKPDIVVPEGSTSNAAPYVSSAATMIVAGASGGLVNARKAETVKAILLAGATKTEFAGQWNRTTNRPLDDVFGAGELNIHRSYNILQGGEQTAGSNGARTGWDTGTTILGTTNYFFTLTENASDLSIVLAWDREVDDIGAGSLYVPVVDLANLDLTLSNASGQVIGSLLDFSDARENGNPLGATAGNLEHIYYTLGLAPGQYGISVTSDTAGVEYGLAWYSTVPEPGAASVMFVASALALTRRRRPQTA